MCYLKVVKQSARSVRIVCSKSERVSTIFFYFFERVVFFFMRWPATINGIFQATFSHKAKCTRLEFIRLSFFYQYKVDIVLFSKELTRKSSRHQSKAQSR